LLNTADNADLERVAAEELATRLEQEAVEADQAGEAAIRRGEQGRTELTTARNLIDRAQASLQAAVDDGILAASDHIFAAAGSARTEAERAKVAVTEGWRRLPELTVARKQARTDALAREPRMAAVLGVDAVDLEVDAEALCDRLDAAIHVAEQQRATLQTAQVEDERILHALGGGGLLPPSQSVTQALAVLEEAGITAAEQSGSPRRRRTAAGRGPPSPDHDHRGRCHRRPPAPTRGARARRVGVHRRAQPRPLRRAGC
jgi:hypothetical protein